MRSGYTIVLFTAACVLPALVSDTLEEKPPADTAPLTRLIAPRNPVTDPQSKPDAAAESEPVPAPIATQPLSRVFAEETFEVANSFVFMNGRYLRQPVTLKVEGRQILVNDVCVFEAPTASKSYASDHEEELPTFPEEITEKSSWAEIEKIKIDGKRWYQRFYGYYMSHFEYAEAVEKLAEAFRALPFVESVKIVEIVRSYGSHRKYLEVWSKAGDRRDVLSAWWSDDRRHDGFHDDLLLDPLDFRPYPQSVIDAQLAEQVAGWKKTLQAEGFVIYSTKFKPIRLERARRPRVWLEVLNVPRIAESRLSRTKKIDAIVRRVCDTWGGYSNNDDERQVISELVDNFESDQQLNERLKELEKTTMIPLWTPPAR